MSKTTVKGTRYSGEPISGDAAAASMNGFVFLTPEWIREVLRLVQCARRSNESFRRLANSFTLKLAYVIQGLPKELRSHYQGGDQAVIFVQLEKGTVRRFEISAHPPAEKVDFTIFSDYSVAKRIFQGELAPGSSFINRLLRVEPLSKAYRNPRFAARSIVAGNLILRFARRARTVFVPEW